jgi:hypothetical protein
VGIILKWDLDDTSDCGLDMFDARYGPIARFCNHCNELWSSVQAGNFSTIQTAVDA